MARRKYNPVTIEMLKELCPMFGNWENCKWYFPYKDISKPDTPEYAHGTWVFKKGLDKECLLSEECQDLWSE